jgi:hypothetical protein
VARLSVLVGSWDVEDVYRSMDGREHRESGVRTCAYVMMNRYLECVTRGRNQAGREREYRWWFSWNPDSGRYELLSLFSNVPLKLHQTVYLDSTGGVWNIRTPPHQEPGSETWLGAELRFDGRDRAVWTGYRNMQSNAITSWQQSSRETWVRRRS